MPDYIYPVPIKPASRIASWGGWPEDVRPTLWAWNHGDERPLHDHKRISRLSFRRSLRGSLYEPGVHVFKCTDCEEFCAPHRNGAAVLDGDWLCDDCLIARARAES